MRILDERVNQIVANLYVGGDKALENSLLPLCLVLVQFLKTDVCIRAGFHVRECACQRQRVGWLCNELLEGGQEMEERWSCECVSMCRIP